jgi:XrtN system VIT domain protein
MGLFFVNYILSGSYLLLLFTSNYQLNRWKVSKGKLEHTVLLLILYFISAFSLNKEMNLFDPSVRWLQISLVIASVALIIASRYHSLPRIINFIVFFILGSSLLLFLYFAIYLLPLYLMSILGLLALGISIHTYIPLFLVIISVVVLVRASREYKALCFAAITGFSIPLILTIFFCISWNSNIKKINGLINQNSLNETKLPPWVYVSQHLKNSFVVERILKAGLSYHVSNNGNFFWGDIRSSSFDEQLLHDPLVQIASLFVRKPNLDEKDQINILKSMYDSRHQAEDRLWSGSDLETNSIITNVKMFTDYRMAYTEKTLTIRNNSMRTWGSEQEAIYTFHLPEGSVTSSLSLWINGQEEKSRLTTKSKADSAYKTIVGVEVRDPSVVHWQEGNTITVRVFPCPTNENRKFKIGITSPLKKLGSTLVYQNIFFDGPEAVNALETVQVAYTGQTAALVLPTGFEQVTPGVYRLERTYDPEWSISLKAPQLAKATFSFANNGYQLTNYHPTYEAFTPQIIYLDLNSAWTSSEFHAVWEKVKTENVYVFADRLTKLTSENKNELFNTMSKQSFSLFPLNEISNPSQSLIVSKSTANSPSLNDLGESEFAQELTAYLKTPRHIRLYNIGSELSPYLKALKELRVLQYTEGSARDLGNLLFNHKFVKEQENENTVVIGNAGLVVEKVDTTSTIRSHSAPDHLLRLFAYNDIMKKVGPDYFNKDFIRPNLIQEANLAYIVTPVSSLIVLESQKDYDRFNIDENKNSLKNASMKSSGAVPEPHEWLLLLTCFCIVIYTIYQKKLKLQIT